MIEAPSEVIRLARPDEAPVLHELTGRSALHWGYKPEFLDWEPQALAVTPQFIQESTVYLLEEEGRIIGYYALCDQPPEMTLDKLFVEPALIGTGRGKRLWLHAIDTARAMDVTLLTFAADPNAAPFYRAMGATWVREEQTSRQGWNLQMFEYEVARGQSPEVRG